MSARVVILWEVGDTPDLPAAGGETCGRWLVYVGDDRGRFRPAGIFAGTEAEAVAAAVAATQGRCAFAEPSCEPPSMFSFGVTTENRPRDGQTSGGTATGG